MEQQTLIIEGTWDEICAHAEEFNGSRLRVTVLPAHTERVAQPEQVTGVDREAKKASSKTLDEKIREITARVPPEEWAKVPSDLSENLDHYVYGLPKRA